MTLCCAENCPNRSENGTCFQNIMKKIPKDKELREKWIHQINRPNYRFGANSFICEFHFTSDQWENKDARKLKKGAVPTLFCYCSRKRLPLKSCEKLIDDHRYSSSHSSARVFSPIIVKTVPELDHAYCDEKENQKHRKSPRKRGRPSKGSGVEHEDTCPMKVRVIDHDYTMLLPVHNVGGEIVPIVNRSETVKLAVPEDSGAIQESLTVENTHSVNLLTKNFSHNLSVEESSNSIPIEESFNSILVEESSNSIPIEESSNSILVEEPFNSVTVEEFSNSVPVELSNSTSVVESFNNTLAEEPSSFPLESTLGEPLSNIVSTDTSFLDKHSLGTIEILSSISDLKRSENFDKSDRNDDTNKLRHEVMKLKREKAVLRVKLSRLQKKYDNLIKRLTGKFI